MRIKEIALSAPALSASEKVQVNLKGS